MEWVFFQLKEPNVMHHRVGMNPKGAVMPNGAKLIDFDFEGTEADALKQANILERNGYSLKKFIKKSIKSK